MLTFSKIDSNLQKIIFYKVHKLHASDLGYKKIIKQIANEFDVKLSLGTLSYWFNNNVKLFGGINKFEPTFSAQLVYVLGVIFGDGNIFLDENKSDYMVRLEAIDKDFVEYFSKCVSKVLNKEKNYAVLAYKRKSMDSIMYVAKARSKHLYYFIKELKKDFEKVKPFAESFPKEFIQGVADSEGCPSISAKTIFKVNVVVAVSTNEKLLNFIKILLFTNFGIKTKFRLQHLAGKTDSIINGRPITRTMNLYSLGVCGFENVKLFSKFIGFSIYRKQNKLIDGIKIFEEFGVSKRVFEWEKIYYKPKSKWINIIDEQ
jgi:intein-encoded DNA endonuclease-like protein